MKGISRLRFYYGIARGALSRAARGGFTRTEKLVEHAYSDNYANETNEDFMLKVAPHFAWGKPALYPVVEHKKFLLRLFADKLISFGTETVLELGSGRGFNLLALALLCPRLNALCGIELSAEGVAVARKNTAHPPLHLLQHLTGMSESLIQKRLKEVRFEFTQGSITALPFADRSFDAVFSNSVIEQIPRDYPQVFAEARRVSRVVGIFSDPFSEAQGWNIFYRFYLKNIDYFCATYRVAEDAGWRVFQFEIPPLQKAVFNTGMLTVVHAPAKKILNR
ncbi:MAG: hypothetical protein UX81_C0004G0012 [Parcubacteria group bacterium GW2011_GWA2_47_12]|nr:MAG: hypothetical protein UX81_C0004G0012 [Parcubacteria group bacterium GW2011_GWA2_47_12]